MSKWYRDPTVLASLAGLSAAAGLYFYYKGQSVTALVSDMISKGKQVTYTHLGANGIVIESPDTVLAMAAAALPYSIDLNVLALARMIRSEGATQGFVRAHVALNDASSLGWSVFDTITYATKDWARGLFGKQYSAKYRAVDGGETWDKSLAAKDADGKVTVLLSQVHRYSTSKDAFEGDFLTAIRAIADHSNGNDPTLGAVKFIDKSSMRVQEGAGSFEDVNSRWTADGLVAYSLPAYGDDLVLYRKG